MNLCEDTVNKSVRVIPKHPAPLVSYNNPVCEGKLLQLKADSIQDAIYHWSSLNGFLSSVQNPVIPNAKLSDAGEYYVYVTINSCLGDSADLDVVVYPNPKIDLGKDTGMCPGELIILDPGFFNSYLWQDNQTNQTYEVRNPGIYSVTVTDEHTCEARDQINIRIICPVSVYIPTIFTPNEDGLNDFVDVFGENILNFEIWIFNRWGMEVFHTNDMNLRWDGKYNGKDCPLEVYYMQASVEFKTGEKRILKQQLYLSR
jgi:gliding motility-associated-like protein